MIIATNIRTLSLFKSCFFNFAVNLLIKKIMNKKNILTIIGFILFLLGFVGIVVNMVGLNFALTDWTYALFGPTFGFLLKILLIIIGIVVVVIANGNNDEDSYDEYFDGKAFK